MQKVKVNPILRMWCSVMSNRRRGDLIRHLQKLIRSTTRRNS